MSGGQNYLLLAMDMAKVGGPLSVVKVCTSMVCIRKNIGKWVVPYRLWSFFTQIWTFHVHSLLLWSSANFVGYLCIHTHMFLTFVIFDHFLG